MDDVDVEQWEHARDFALEVIDVANVNAVFDSLGPPPANK